MSKKKRTVSELLKEACQYAINDQVEFLEAIDGIEGYEKARGQTESFLKEIRAYKNKRWPRRQKTDD